MYVACARLSLSRTYLPVYTCALWRFEKRKRLWTDRAIYSADRKRTRFRYSVTRPHARSSIIMYYAHRSRLVLNFEKTFFLRCKLENICPKLRLYIHPCSVLSGIIFRRSRWNIKYRVLPMCTGTVTNCRTYNIYVQVLMYKCCGV